MGKLADKFGSKIVFCFGLVLFVLVYAGVGMNTNIVVFYVLFFLYGLYMAATEGVSRAWISNIASKEETGVALGVYAALNSILTLLASVVAGIICTKYGAQATFYLTAAVTALVIIYFILAVKMSNDSIANSEGHSH